MKFIELDIVAGERGKIVSFWLNPNQLVGVVKAGVPGQVSGPDGVPTMVEKGALDLGIKVLITNYSVKELIKKLEEV